MKPLDGKKLSLSMRIPLSIRLIGPILLLTGVFYYNFSTNKTLDLTTSLAKEKVQAQSQPVLSIKTANDLQLSISKGSEIMALESNATPVSDHAELASYPRNLQQAESETIEKISLAKILASTEAPSVGQITEQLDSVVLYKDEARVILDTWLEKGLINEDAVRRIQAVNGLNREGKVETNTFIAQYSPEILRDIVAGEYFSIPLNNEDQAQFMVVDRVEGMNLTSLATVNLENEKNGSFSISTDGENVTLFGTYNLDNVSYKFQSSNGDTLVITERGS